jgi:hypothetical protein
MHDAMPLGVYVTQVTHQVVNLNKRARYFDHSCDVTGCNSI